MAQLTSSKEVNVSNRWLDGLDQHGFVADEDVERCFCLAGPSNSYPLVWPPIELIIMRPAG